LEFIGKSIKKMEKLTEIYLNFKNNSIKDKGVEELVENIKCISHISKFEVLLL